MTFSPALWKGDSLRMDWISGWLKQIVLIILFAVFIDLILPNQSMQRYVRVVISLVILLAILEPVLTLIQGSPMLDSNRLSTFFSASMNTASMKAETATNKRMKSLTEIMKNAEELKRQNQEEWKGIVESGLAGMIKDRLDQENPRAISQVTVRVNDGGGEQPSIESVRVVLSSREPDDSGSVREDSAMEPVKPPDVEPIRPVQIRIDLQKSASRGSADEAALPAHVPLAPGSEGDASRLKMKITRQIMTDWNLKSEQIEVDVEADQLEQH